MGMSEKTEAHIKNALKRAVDLGEVGVQVAAYLGEELIVDAWIGKADPECDRPVDADTLFQTFSIGKAITFTALHLQVERGLLEYDAPIARYWPEYGKHGKDRVLVRHVLEQRSGVPQMPDGISIENFGEWDRIVRGIAELRPMVAPGTVSTYQSLNLGWVLGTVIERSDPKGRSIKDFIQEEILDPLGIRDIWMGIPPEEDHRLAKLCGGPLVSAPGFPLRKFDQPEDYNRASTILRRAVAPATNSMMTARAQARFWALLANRGELGGVRLLREGHVWSFTQPRPNPYEIDRTLGYAPLIGVGGYWLGGPYPPAEPGVGEGSYILSHTGFGGSIGWADLETRLSVAICHNRMFLNQPPVAADQHPHTAIGHAIRAIAAEIA